MYGWKVSLQYSERASCSVFLTVDDMNTCPPAYVILLERGEASPEMGIVQMWHTFAYFILSQSCEGGATITIIPISWSKKLRPGGESVSVPGATNSRRQIPAVGSNTHIPHQLSPLTRAQGVPWSRLQIQVTYLVLKP